MISTLRDSKARLSELVNKATKGEEVLISVRGVPMVRLVPVARTEGTENTKKWVARLRRQQRGYRGSVASTDSTLLIEGLRQERG